MNDCANADIRDRLPELVNGTLSAAEVAEVELHIQGCVDCQQELAVVRSVRTMLRAKEPTVDVARIVSALPVAGRPTTRSWAAWKVAAAITVVVLGGGTFAVMSRGGVRTPTPEAAPSTVAAVAAVPETVPVTATAAQPHRSADAHVTSSPSTTASGAEMTVATSVGNLSDSQLDGLINRIDQVEAVPLAEPVSRSVPIVLADSISVKDLGGSK